MGFNSGFWLYAFRISECICVTITYSLGFVHFLWKGGGHVQDGGKGLVVHQRVDVGVHEWGLCYQREGVGGGMFQREVGGREGGVQNEGRGWVYHVAEGRYTRSGWGLGVSEASGSVVYLGREWCVPEVVIQTVSWLFIPAGTCHSGIIWLFITIKVLNSRFNNNMSSHNKGHRGGQLGL